MTLSHNPKHSKCGVVGGYPLRHLLPNKQSNLWTPALQVKLPLIYLEIFLELSFETSNKFNLVSSMTHSDVINNKWRWQTHIISHIFKFYAPLFLLNQTRLMQNQLRKQKYQLFPLICHLEFLKHTSINGLKLKSQSWKITQKYVVVINHMALLDFNKKHNI